MAVANDVIKIARAELGYHEKASNKDLDSKTGNSGSGNWTKYARDLYNAGYYNGNKNGFEWCDMFVDWCFFKAFGKTGGQRVQCQTGPLGAACPYSADYYKAQGRYDKTPKLGDQVFFQQGGSLVHTGLVVGVTSSNITVIEGNRNNQVMEQTYSRSNSYVSGFGHPKYDGVSNDPWVKDGGEYRYRNPKTGEYVSDMWVESSRGMWYYIGEDGIMVHSGLTFVHSCRGIYKDGEDAGAFSDGWYYFQDDNENGCQGALKSGEITITASTTPKVQAVNKAVFNTKHDGRFGVCTSINGKPVEEVLAE